MAVSLCQKNFSEYYLLHVAQTFFLFSPVFFIYFAFENVMGDYIETKTSMKVFKKCLQTTYTIKIL